VGDPCTDLLANAPASRCPACAAALRPGAPWCTLCYADLRPAPETPAEPAPAPVRQPRFDPLTAPVEMLGLPGRHAVADSLGPVVDPPPTAGAAWWPCSACGTGNPLIESVCSACGTGFLAGVREAEGPLLLVPGVGDLAALSRAQRLGMAASVVLMVSLVTAILALLTG